jgi:hypothetical protein
MAPPPLFEWEVPSSTNSIKAHAFNRLHANRGAYVPFKFNALPTGCKPPRDKSHDCDSLCRRLANDAKAGRISNDHNSGKRLTDIHFHEELALCTNTQAGASALQARILTPHRVAHSPRCSLAPSSKCSSLFHRARQRNELPDGQAGTGSPLAFHQRDLHGLGRTWRCADFDLRNACHAEKRQKSNSVHETCLTRTDPNARIPDLCELIWRHVYEKAQHPTSALSRDEQLNNRKNFRTKPAVRTTVCRNSDRFAIAPIRRRPASYCFAGEKWSRLPGWNGGPLDPQTRR